MSTSRLRTLQGHTLRVLLLSALAASALVAVPAAASAAACPAAGGSGVPTAAGPAGSDFVVRGHGWGHTLGKSQYGAQGAARLGCTHDQILRTYYTGAQVQSQTLQPAVMVSLLSDGTSTTVETQTGSITWRSVQAGQSVVQPLGQTWSVVRTATGHYLRDQSGATRFWVPSGHELRALQQGKVTRVRTLRGSTAVTDLRIRWDYTRFITTAAGLQAWQVIENNATGAGTQKYLWGLAEVPVTWPGEALRTQAVAARTYLARRWNASLNAYVIGTTTATQHWTGYAQEAADAAAGGHWKAAVDATIHRVVTNSSGALLDTLYSSSHGGRSEDARYVYGNDVPYLRSVDDSRWDLASDNPYRSWAAGMSSEQVAAALGVDSVSNITLAPHGSADRLAGATVTGVRSGAPVTLRYTGWELRQRLGVRSPGITSMTWQVPPGSQPLSGDWDGDGDDDFGWYSGGRFTLRMGDGSSRSFAHGLASDLPVVGDWDGDGRDGVGVFRSGQWYLRNTLSAGVSQVRVRYGVGGDIPVAGRWPGASREGIGVVRGGAWHLKRTVAAGGADVLVNYGWPSDRKVVGDWDGNGTDTPGIVRGKTWFLSNGLGSAASTTVGFGTATDLPLSGDWDGDARTTIAVVRGATFYWRDDLSAGPATGTVVFVP